MRRADAFAFIDMGKNAEFQIGILVEDLSVFGIVRSEIRRHEISIGACTFGVLTAQFTPGRTWLLCQRGAAVCGELLEGIRHSQISRA